MKSDQHVTKDNLYKRISDFSMKADLDKKN